LKVKEVEHETELGNYNILFSYKNKILPVPYFQGPYQLLFNFKNIRRSCKAWFETKNSSRLVLFRFPSLLGLVFYILNLRKTFNFVLEIVAHPLEISQNHKNIFEKTFWRIMHFFQVLLTRKAVAVSYVTSETLQKTYRVKNPRTYTSYYSSIELDDGFFQSRKTFGLDGKIRICLISHPINNYFSGHHTLINVVSELLKRGIDVDVCIAGDGPLVSEFKKRVEELGVQKSFFWLGHLNREGVKRLLINSDFMIYASLSDGLPRVVIESMASGVIPLSTSAGGIPELLDMRFLCDKNDYDCFVDKICKYVSNEESYFYDSKALQDKAAFYKKDLLNKKRTDFFAEVDRICDK
jgi:glycosyltransferase involved in cell wall biosynthesis